jgi:predicted Na+-dependent transporter
MRKDFMSFWQESAIAPPILNLINIAILPRSRPKIKNGAMSMQFGIYEQVFLALAVFLVSFGLGLDLEIAQFKHFLKRPRQVILGVFAQVIIFPAASLAFVYIFKPQAPIALAILLVASCPGGSLSNYLTFLLDNLY